MASFNPLSRYVKFAQVALGRDRHGREVAYVTPARIAPQAELGSHRLRDGQRLDHLANHYLDDPTGYWRLASHNDVMDPDAALADDFVEIPIAD